MNARSDGANRLTVLTDRRSQVATLASQGLSNRQIAEKLGVSEGTVKIHLRAIYEKLDIHTRAELKSALNPHAGHKKKKSDFIQVRTDNVKE